MGNTSLRKDPWRDIYEEQATSAASLWHLRAVAVKQPHNRPADLARLERRIDDHLGALRHRPDLSWSVCRDELAIGQAGDIFVAATLALPQWESRRTSEVIEAGLANDNAFRGLASALAWLPDRLSRHWTETLLTSRDPNRLYLAIAVCGLRSENPGEHLTRILQRDELHAQPKLFARGLRIAGIFKRMDLANAVESAADADDAGVHFWALWSSILLGRRDRAPELKPYVKSVNPWQRQAIQLAFRVLPVETAKEWINELAQDAARARDTLKATAALGTLDAVPWLIEAMQDPLLARLAGETFTTLTGRDLARSGLALDRPPVPIDLLDDQDLDVILEDDKLPWPNPDAVADAWKRAAPHYRPEERYFLGETIDRGQLREVVTGGLQRQRHAAALELALREPRLPLPNTCARQRAA